MVIIYLKKKLQRISKYKERDSYQLYMTCHFEGKKEVSNKRMPSSPSSHVRRDPPAYLQHDLAYVALFKNRTLFNVKGLNLNQFLELNLFNYHMYQIYYSNKKYVVKKQLHICCD